MLAYEKMCTREHTYLLTKRIHTLAVTVDEIVTRTVHVRDSLFLPSPAYMTYRAQPKPPCYAGYVRNETVSAQVCRRLQSRDEEIVLSTTLIKLVHLHNKFLMLTFRSSARTSSRGRGVEGGPLYLALTGMCIFVSSGDWEEGKKEVRRGPPRTQHNLITTIFIRIPNGQLCGEEILKVLSLNEEGIQFRFSSSFKWPFSRSNQLYDQCAIVSGANCLRPHDRLLFLV